jgi:hypothetical protein
MIFVIGYSDGHELLGSESFDGADAVCEAEDQSQEKTDGNLGVVLVEPSMSFQNGRWVARYAGVEKPLHCDHRRKPSWSADGQHWESCYHAIEKLFSSIEAVK